MVRLDMEQIYRNLGEKVHRHETLSKENLMKLMVLPVAVKGKEEKQEVITRAVELAKQIPDRSQTVQALAGILTFSDKIIDEAYRERVKEEMQTTKVGQMIFEDGFEQGIEQGIRAGIRAVIVTCKTLGGSKTDAISMIINQFSLTGNMAQKFVEEFWEES